MYNTAFEDDSFDDFIYENSDRILERPEIKKIVMKKIFKSIDEPQFYQMLMARSQTF